MVNNKFIISFCKYVNKQSNSVHSFINIQLYFFFTVLLFTIVNSRSINENVSIRLLTMEDYRSLVELHSDRIWVIQLSASNEVTQVFKNAVSVFENIAKAGVINCMIESCDEIIKGIIITGRIIFISSVIENGGVEKDFRNYDNFELIVSNTQKLSDKQIEIRMKLK